MDAQPNTGPNTTTSSATSLPAERLAGRYELGEPLGKGRSTVYRATDVRLQRPVAVKRVEIAAGQEDAERVRSRAMREAQAAARLNNPSVVTVYDVVEEGGSIWLVMELVEAPSLAQIVADEGPVSHARAAQAGLDVLAALEAAHAVGIVHRDVKPANVLVAPDDRAKLTDFGVATIRDDSRLTATGLIVGSPSYMSPEQARGDTVGPATDLWALGALLYFATEGETPFQGDSALATASAVVHGRPRPARRPGPLSVIVTRLLMKDPGNRATPGEVRAALTRAACPPAPARTAPARTATLPMATAAVSPAADPGPRGAAAPGWPGRAGPGAVPAWGPGRAAAGPVPAAAAGGGGPGPAAGCRGGRCADRRRRRRGHRLAAVDHRAGRGAGDHADHGRAGPHDHDHRAGHHDHRAAGSRGRAPGLDGLPGPERPLPHRLPRGLGGRPRERVATLTDFRDPATGAKLRVDWTDTPGADPAQAWRDLAVSFARAHANYEELGIAPTTYRDYNAALWEFRYGSGPTVHAANLGFVTGGRGYALLFTAPEEQWAASQATSDQFRQAFQPVPA